MSATVWDKRLSAHTLRLLIKFHFNKRRSALCIIHFYRQRDRKQSLSHFCSLIFPLRASPRADRLWIWMCVLAGEKRVSIWVSKQPRWSHVWHHLTQSACAEEHKWRLVLDVLPPPPCANKLNCRAEWIYMLCVPARPSPGDAGRTHLFTPFVYQKDEGTPCFVFAQELGLLFAGQFVLSTSTRRTAD